MFLGPGTDIPIHRHPDKDESIVVRKHPIKYVY